MAVWHLLRNAARYASTVRRNGAHARPANASSSGLDWPIFVINLERSEHRRRFALNHLQSLGFEGRVFPAVDGRALDLGKLVSDGVYDDAVAKDKFSRSLSMPEIGCTLSHIRLYERMLSEGLDHAIVLEDDAMFVDDIVTRLPALIDALPADWDLVQLIYKCEDHEPAAPGVVRFRMQASMPVASAAYLIRRAGAEKMKANSYPVRYPADSFIGRSPRWGMQVYGAQPQLVTINNVFPSSIYGGRSLRARAGKRVKELVVRLLG